MINNNCFFPGSDSVVSMGAQAVFFIAVLYAPFFMSSPILTLWRRRSWQPDARGTSGAYLSKLHFCTQQSLDPYLLWAKDISISFMIWLKLFCPIY